jgi:hypothetical protein
MFTVRDHGLAVTNSGKPSCPRTTESQMPIAVEIFELSVASVLVTRTRCPQLRSSLIQVLT